MANVDLFLVEIESCGSTFLKAWPLIANSCSSMSVYEPHAVAGQRQMVPVYL